MLQRQSSLEIIEASSRIHGGNKPILAPTYPVDCNDDQMVTSPAILKTHHYLGAQINASLSAQIYERKRKQPTPFLHLAGNNPRALLNAYSHFNIVRCKKLADMLPKIQRHPGQPDRIIPQTSYHVHKENHQDDTASFCRCSTKTCKLTSSVKMMSPPGGGP